MIQSPTLYKHYVGVPVADWRWPNFSPKELACKGSSALLVDPTALDRLQALRTRLGKPMIVNSAYRSPAYNKEVGGAQNSMHLYGKAFDISMAGHDPVEFAKAAKECGFTGFGHYRRQGFMHIDVGPARVWYTGGKFPGF